MSIISTMRRILNDTPGTATNIDYNFQVIENYVNTALVPIDGSNAMTGPLVLNAPPVAANHAVTKGYADALFLPGMSVEYGGTTAPEGWVLENGAAYSSTDPKYAALFAVIQYRFGDAGGGNFRVPPAGRFVVNVDPSHPPLDTVGKMNAITARNSELLSHVHTVPVHGHGLSGSIGNDTTHHSHNFAGGTVGRNQGHTHASNGGHTEVMFRDGAYNTGYRVGQAVVGPSDLALTWGPLGTESADHAHSIPAQATGGVNNNHVHGHTFSINNAAAFDTNPNGAGTTLTDKNMPQYVVMNRIMKL